MSPSCCDSLCQSRAVGCVVGTRTRVRVASDAYKKPAPPDHLLPGSPPIILEWRPSRWLHSLMCVTQVALNMPSVTLAMTLFIAKYSYCLELSDNNALSRGNIQVFDHVLLPTFNIFVIATPYFVHDKIKIIVRSLIHRKVSSFSSVHCRLKKIGAYVIVQGIHISICINYGRYTFAATPRR